MAASGFPLALLRRHLLIILVGLRWVGGEADDFGPPAGLSRAPRIKVSDAMAV